MPVARTSTDYLRSLQSLLPLGKAWNRTEGSNLTEFLHGEAEEFARVDQRSVDLLVERDTRTSSELLIDHEIDLGLPDECSPDTQTIQERRLSAHSRLITLGQQNPAYFIEIAAALGWTIAITEFTPFWMNVGTMGEPIGDQTNIFYWKVTITLGGGDIIYFLVGSSQMGDPLSFVPGTDSLICILKKYKPAHTTLLFDFDGPAFDQGFSSGFDSIPSQTEEHLTGGFDQGFSSGFDVNWGGGFSKDGFDIGFKIPN